jgi:putative exosortase-associated protein (TIGR04073 family)
MKKVVVVVALLFAMTAPALAQEATDEGPQYTIFTKFFRGVGNLIVSPFEIPVSAFHVAADTDVFIGASAGTVAGVAAGAERAAAGAMDVVTFLFPPYDRALITYSLGKSPAAQAAVQAFPREL